MVEWPICNTGGHIKGGPRIEAIVGRFIETASVKGPPEGCVQICDSQRSMCPETARDAKRGSTRPGAAFEAEAPVRQVDDHAGVLEEEKRARHPSSC